MEEVKTVPITQLTISSRSFMQDGMIPSKFTCEGENVSPSLDIENIPVEANTLAVIVDDPDAPNGTWVHWTAWNIPVDHMIKEGMKEGVHGLNDFGDHGYGGPCPPSGTHHYHFKVYALDTRLLLHKTASKGELEKAMKGHIVALGEMIGKYSRRKYL